MKKEFKYLSLRSTEIIALIILIFLFLITIYPLISADPPSTLSRYSMGEYGDPGTYAFNARNKVLFGKWVIDAWTPMYLSIIPHYFTFACFKTFGVSYFSLNLVPLFFAIFILIFFYFLIKRITKKVYLSIIFTYLLAFNYYFFVYSKIANRTVPPILWVLVSLLIIEIYYNKKDKKESLYFFLSGFFLFLSVLSKPKIIYMFALFILTIIIKELLNKQNIKSILKKSFYFTSGFSIPCILSIVFFVFPNKNFFLLFFNHVKELAGAFSCDSLLKNFIFQPLHLFSSLTIFLTILYVISIFFLETQGILKKSFTAILSFIWVPFLVSYLSIESLRPIRYYYEIIYPLYLVTLILIANMKELHKENKQKKFPLFSFLLLSWILIIFFIYIIRSFKFYTYFLKINYFILAIILITIISLCFFIIFRKFLKYRKINSKYIIVFFILLLSLSGIKNISNIIKYYNKREYRIKEISSDIGRAYSQTGLSGLLAPTMSLENSHIAHISWKGLNINDNKDFLEKNKIELILATNFNNETNYYFSNFKKDMKNMNLVAIFKLWKTNIFLYHKGEKTNIAPVKKLEAEIIPRYFGIVVFRKQASNKWILYLKKGEIGKICEISLSKKYSGLDVKYKTDKKSSLRIRINNLYELQLPPTRGNFRTFSFHLNNLNKIVKKVEIFKIKKSDTFIDFFKFY